MVNKRYIGKLDRYVEIVEYSTVKDAYNSNQRTEASIKNVWANVQFKSSTEDFDEKVYSINKPDYIIHFDSGIAAKNLQDLAVKDDGVTYYVTGATLDFGGRNRFILLNCKSDA